LLDAEKIKGDYLVYVCDENEGAKEELMVYVRFLIIFGGADTFD
jgi:hypothetical protein